jgi:hypothetical protein
MADDDEPMSLTDLAGLLIPESEGNNEAAPSAKATNGQTAPPSDEPGPDNSQEETESEEEPEAEGDEPEGEEGEEPSTEPNYTVKVDGKEVSVTLKEALAGYQRQADYTRRTQEAAEIRRTAEAETATARAARDQYSQVLNVILERLGPENQELNAEQWNKLSETDPVGYSVQWAHHQRREAQRAAVKAEQQRIAEEKRGETLGHIRTFIEGERQKLVKAIPVLADPEKGPDEMKAMREYAAKTFNFTDQELDQAYDHRMLLMLDKARKWDTHQASLAKGRGKIENAPQVSPPSARQPAKMTKALAKKVAFDRFTKSGEIEDALPLMFLDRR